MTNVLQSLFGDSSSVPYPMAPTGGAPACGTGSYQPGMKDNLFNRWFSPDQLPYPSAPCAVPTVPRAPIEPIVAGAPSAPVLPPIAALRVMRGYAFSPEITPSFAEAHASFVAAEVGEVLTQRLHTFEGQVFSLLVPDGCDSLELSFGAIEENPGVGSAEDADELVALGRPRTSKVIERGLVAGEQVSVIVPWRAASWVDMPAGRLRVKVTATFCKSQS